MIFSFSHNHIGMVIHAGKNSQSKEIPLVFIDRYSITPCQYFSCLSGDVSTACRKNTWAYQLTSSEKEEYFHG
jgi:hypothetical protein